MLRRFTTLCGLLLSLGAGIPAAVACAGTAQSADCCPMGQPCEKEGAAAFVVPASHSCCIAQPSPTRSAVVVVNGQSDRRFADSEAPDHSAAPAPSGWGVLSSLHEQTALAVPLPIRVDQQQVYLRTGRLRL